MPLSFIHERCVSSTQDSARQLIHEGHPAPFILYADQQTHGRGREKRAWHSPNTGNLYATLCYAMTPPQQNFPTASCNLVAALTIAELLRHQQIPVTIKWPNDLLIERNKFCGILTESFAYNGQLVFLIGFGLNVNSTLADLKTVATASTSLKIFDTRERDREELLQQIASKLLTELSIWQQQGFKPFLKRYAHCFFLAPGDTFFREEQLFKFIRIAQDGSLEVETISGSPKKLYSGELSTHD